VADKEREEGGEEEDAETGELNAHEAAFSTTRPTSSKNLETLAAFCASSSIFLASILFRRAFLSSGERVCLESLSSVFSMVLR
jgi:hypothetical protein